MEQTMTVQEAADALGVSQQYIRELMKRGIADIGVVYPSLRSGERNRYLISRAKFENFVNGGNRNDQ